MESKLNLLYTIDMYDEADVDEFYMFEERCKSIAIYERNYPIAIIKRGVWNSGLYCNVYETWDELFDFLKKFDDLKVYEDNKGKLLIYATDHDGLQIIEIKQINSRGTELQEVRKYGTCLSHETIGRLMSSTYSKNVNLTRRLDYDKSKN